MLLTERHGTARNGTERHKFSLACLEWLDRESSFIFWMVIFNLTVTPIDFHSQYSLIRKILIFAVDNCIITFFTVIIDLILYCSLHRYKLFHRIAKIFLLMVNICLFFGDVFALYYWKLPINSLMLDLVFMTNYREAGEFLQVYIINNFSLLYFSAALFSLLIIYMLFRLIFRHRILFYSLSLLLVCCGGLSAGRDIFFRQNGRRTHILSYTGSTRLCSMLWKIYIDKRAYQAIINAYPKEALITKNEKSIPYVIFILGESTNRNKMELYGYNLHNTPNFIERQKNNNGKLYVFDDVVSSHAWTTLSMQKIFTFYRYDSSGDWSSFMNLFTILNDAGYNTIWLSNQAKYINASILSFLPSMCSYSRFTELEEGWDSNTLDEKLLAFLDEEMPRIHDNGKNFLLLHLMGTHADYKKRYTEEYNIFSAQDETGGFEGITEEKQTVRAQYDNAVLYNDFIVNEIIKRFEDKNAIVIYISDHGDQVYDTMDIIGHYEGKADTNLIEIPMIIWLSEKFSESYPELEARIAASTHKPYMTDDMIHTVLDIMSIETPEYDPAKSIINASFDITRPRIYSGHLYDKEKGLIAVQ